MADLKKLAEEIIGLTLLEAQELKTILKDEYGIEPAAGGAVVMAGAATLVATQQQRRLNSTSFSNPLVHLKSTSSKKFAASQVLA